jgi:hypothetical protein
VVAGKIFLPVVEMDIITAHKFQPCQRCGSSTSATAVFENKPLCRRCYMKVPQRRRDAEMPFLVFGSLVNPSRTSVKDIDLVVPEFMDARRIWVSYVALDVYERLATATGVPVELWLTPSNHRLFSTPEGSLTVHVIGQYRSGGPWRMRMSPFREFSFDGLVSMTFAEICAAVRTKRVRRGDEVDNPA